MSFAIFVATFWPLIVVYVLAYIVIPILATVLSLVDRRRYVRRLHRMRRG